MSTAADFRQQLLALQRERALAHEYGLSFDPMYMADLDGEIAETRAAYVGAAVTEIASLRAALTGPLAG